MLAIKDLQGEVYLLTGASEIKRVRRVNGEKEFSLVLDKTKQNAHFFDDIEKLWRVIDFNGEEYPVLLYRDIAEGDGYARQLSCLHSFFDDMRNHVIYEQFTGSRTFLAMMQFIFNGSGYTFNIVDSFFAQSFENFGDDYGLELFKTALERYQAEFSVDGKIVTLKTQIGDTTDFQYRHKFNLESIEREVDALDFSTYAEGFGKDGLHVTYTSPLAAVYGERPIKAVRDERYTVESSLLARLKEDVDNSLRIALTVKLSDLRASGYNKNHPNEGDTIILVDERFGLKIDARIVEITETLRPDGTVLDCDVMLSNFSNIFEQQRRIHNATKTIADAVEGKRPLPFAALDYAVQQATIALQNAQTELSFPSNGGILAVDKTNPNNIVIFNSAGLGISDDAGATFETAITGAGIVAEAITAGVMRGMTFESESADSRMWIQGGDIRLEDLASGQYLNQNSRGFTGFNAAGDILFQANQTWVTTGIVGTTTTNFYMASYNEARAVHIDSLPGNGAVDAYTYIPFRADGYKGNYLDVNTGTGATNLYLRPALMGEVRVTAGGTIDVYYPLRAANIHGSAFISTVANAWIGADDELRVMDKALSGDYKDVRARGYFGTFMTADEGLYIYMGTDLGLRVTSRGLASAGPIYRDVTAASFSNGSRIESKENIELWTADALALINGSDLTTYHLKGDLEQERVIRKYGLVLGGDYRAPQEVVNGDGIDQYAMTTVAWRAIQQLSEELAALKAEVGATS